MGYAMTVVVPLQIDNKCHEGVTRGGEYQPCNRLAVALRLDPVDGSPYPVCVAHTRVGQMVPLSEMSAALSNLYQKTIH